MITYTRPNVTLYSCFKWYVLYFYSYSDEAANPDCQPTILSAKTPPLSPQAHSFFAQLILRPHLLQATKGLSSFFCVWWLGLGKGPDGGCDRLTYWLTDWLRLQTIRFAWLKPCVSNHCKCGTWCLLNYYKRLSWRSQKNLKIIESDLTLDRIGHLV